MVRDDIYAFYEMRCHPDFLRLTPGLIKPFPSFRAAEAYMRWIDQAVARRAFVAWLDPG